MKKTFLFFTGLLSGILISAAFVYYILSQHTTISKRGEKMSIDEKNPIQLKNQKEAVVIKNIKPKEFLDMRKKLTKPTIAYFWASWCYACHNDLPYLIKYCKNRNIDIWLISVDKNNDKQNILTSNYLNSLGVKMTYIIDESISFDMKNVAAFKTFTKDIGIDSISKEPGLPYALVMSVDGKYRKSFGGMDIKNAHDDFFNQNVK